MKLMNWYGLATGYGLFGGGRKIEFNWIYLVAKLCYCHRSQFLLMFKRNVFWLFICDMVRRVSYNTSRAKGVVMQTWLSHTFNVLEIMIYDNVYHIESIHYPLGPEKKFQNYGSQRGMKCCFDIGVCKYIIS